MVSLLNKWLIEMALLDGLATAAYQNPGIGRWSLDEKR